MIKSATLFTYEVDDSKKAVNDILSQLGRKISLMKNTVGIIMCDPEFAFSDVLKEVCESLPFPVAGATTASQVVNEESGSLILTIMVLTSDDVFFETGVSEPIAQNENVLKAVCNEYAETAKKLPFPSNPDLIFIFPPLIDEISGDQYIRAFKSLCPAGVPVFGSIAADNSIGLRSSFTIYNGIFSRDAVPFILISGNISPRFFVSPIIAGENKNVLPYRGKITKSEGNIIRELNNIRAYDYFESLGLTKDGNADEGLKFIPILLDMENKVGKYRFENFQLARTLFAFDKNGYGICRGDVCQDSNFTLINVNSGSVIESAKKMTDYVNSLPDKQAVLMFSCITRRTSLSVSSVTEENIIKKFMNSDTPFMMAYSGGEICPISVRQSAKNLKNSQNSVSNQFHNYSFVACIL
ncbi:MAG: FIST C-terminal domain-containing protein [Oscillospiraceae bacterium]|nr:FIST C-terminal domain-containing protein [Oscillospiraceae bacterium]